MSAGSITELVRVLVAAGATPDMILAAVTAAEATKDAAIEASRSKARARVQRWRDNHNETSRNVTQRSVADTSRLTRVEDSSSKKDISGKEESKIDAPVALSPRGELEKVLDAERAAAVVEHRQRIKKPLTPRAARLLANSLSKAPDANAAADTMIEKGWQSFELAWLENRTAPRPFSTASPKGGSPKTFDEGGTGPREQTKFLKQFEELKKSQAMQS